MRAWRFNPNGGPACDAGLFDDTFILWGKDENMERIFGKISLERVIGSIGNDTYFVFDVETKKYLGELDRHEGCYSFRNSKSRVLFRTFKEFVCSFDYNRHFEFVSEYLLLPPLAEAMTKSWIFKVSIVVNERCTTRPNDDLAVYNIMIINAETDRCATKRELEALDAFDLLKEKGDYEYVYDLDEIEDRVIRHVSRKDLLEFLEKC